jgi:hypothetical protein
MSGPLSMNRRFPGSGRMLLSVLHPLAMALGSIKVI